MILMCYLKFFFSTNFNFISNLTDFFFNLCFSLIIRNLLNRLLYFFFELFLLDFKVSDLKLYLSWILL